MLRTGELWCFGLILASIGASGCVDQPPAVLEYRAWDSAGVEVVETGTPVHTGENGWELAREPMLELGSAQGTEPFLFSRIWDALLLPDGQIVVSDEYEPHVRIFDADGSHIVSVGQSGEGPEEFGAAPMLAFRPPDTLLAWDPQFYRLSRYGLDGTLLDQRSLRERIRGEHGLPHIFGLPIWQVRGDGTLLWTGSLSVPRPVDGLHQITKEPIVFGPDGDPVIRLGSLPLSQGLGFEYGDGRLSRVVNAFSHSSTHVIASDPYLVVSAASELPELHYITASGDTARILRAPVPRAPVTRSMVAEEREELLESVGSWGGDVPPSLAGDAFDALPIPDSLPAFRNLHMASSGDVWAERRRLEDDASIVLDVFAHEDGRWLGTVRTPEQVQRILAIGEDAVLVENLDDQDVPQLRLHRIERPPRTR